MKYDVRVLSASKRSLPAEVDQGQFLEDLFYRLYAVEISIPPLRDRRDDMCL